MNKKAFNIFLDTHQDTLYKMIRSRVNSERDAEDILQEVLLKIYQNGDTFKGRSQLNTWFFSICKNAISDYYRKPWWKFSWVFKHSEPYDHTWNDPEQQLLNSEQQDRLFILLKTLSPREQDVFRLRFFSHFSLQDIAKCLDITLSTTKTHLYRAVKKMQITIQQDKDRL